MNTTMENIQKIPLHTSAHGSVLTFSITVKSGKTRECFLAEEGNFNGQTRVGTLGARPQDVRQILLT